MRAGDVYAELVKYWKSVGNFEQAFQTIEKMRARRIYVAPYLDSQLLAEIYRAVGQDVAGADEDDGVGEEIDEISEMPEDN